MAEGNGTGNGFEMEAGPAKVKATGSTVITVLLACLIVAANFYSVFVTNQQTMTIQAEHAQHLAIISTDHRAMVEAMREQAQASDSVFLSTLMTPDQKQDLPGYLKARAKAIVERKAQTVTESRQ